MAFNILTSSITNHYHFREQHYSQIKIIYYSYYIAEDIKSDIKTAVSSTKLYVMVSNIAPSNTTPVLRPN